MKAKKWVIARNFDGEPKDGDLKLVEEDIPELKQGDVLLEAEYWTVDPYMRAGNRGAKPGDGMPGQFYGRVSKSKNPDYPVGKPLLGSFGWRTHHLFNPKTVKSGSNYPGVKQINFNSPPDTGDLSKSVTLGVLGMPGATAYFGFLELCKPKAGETVLVSGAAGAVGSLVGQIAKIKGCKVIGFAGSEDKVKYLTDELGFDAAFNYKKVDVSEALSKAAPKGIDCYFDNVGGTFSTTVITGHMNVYGRVALCGVISRYNDTTPALGPEVYGSIVVKQLSLQGFIVTRWFDKWNEAFAEMLKWIKEGKLKYREHVTNGFENMYTAFRGLLKGENRGKAIIKA